MKFSDFALEGCCQVGLTFHMRINNLPLWCKVDGYAKAVSNFMQHDRIKKTLRVCNIVYDLEDPTGGLVFPHVHLICACDESYFAKGSYISRDELQQIWRECLGVDYDPVVYTRRIFPSDDVGR